MNEVNLLFERARSKLSAAKMLFREGYFDDAVSRAYYSMHFAEVWLAYMKKRLI